ncbi:bacterioferritin-associated ferredoxin protein [Cupriavidus basilensis OR16]|uniref:Bacterioferritin-associated ferredoxin n=1 Tax=Cupriavidus basilensis OR16 TaxID=1127483 RepID=H1S7U3_9BURK|nr:bacterioferritin-associated ferredoxin protein [Cupriavidus basilensis OR16]
MTCRCHPSPKEGFVYVCICNQVTDREIHGAAHLGVSTLDELAETLGVGTCCGRCRECAQQVLCEGVAAVRNVKVSTIQVVAISSCSSSGPRAIMDTRDPAVANDQRTELVA